MGGALYPVSVTSYTRIQIDGVSAFTRLCRRPFLSSFHSCTPGKQNYLFFGDAGAGHRSATLHCLLGSRLRRGITSPRLPALALWKTDPGHQPDSAHPDPIRLRRGLPKIRGPSRTSGLRINRPPPPPGKIGDTTVTREMLTLMLITFAL